MIEVNDFTIGEYARMGSDYSIAGNIVTIGDHFYHSRGLRVGGGGHKGPNANLTVGDRCVMHNNFINVCEPVVIGNDVGLSEEVSIITHGYWLSVLEGHPRKFAGVTIGNGVIVGYRSIILPGVTIVDECVIGAGSVVTRSLKKKGIYAGNPAKFIKGIKKPSKAEQLNLAVAMLDDYKWKHKLSTRLNFPIVSFMDFHINLLTFEYWGEESEETDHFRDFIRKYGIRIYTERPFG